MCPWALLTSDFIGTRLIFILVAHMVSFISLFLFYFYVFNGFNATTIKQKNKESFSVVGTEEIKQTRWSKKLSVPRVACRVPVNIA